MINAFIAAVGNAFEVIQSKRVLSIYKMPSKTLLTLGSALIFILMVFISFFWGGLDFSKIKSIHYILFLGVIIVGFFYNYLYYYSLKRGALCDVEPLAMFHPLLTMILAVIIFPDERNYYILIPALFAATTLIVTRVQKHHLKMHKYTAAMLGFVILMAIESNLVKPLLEVVSPVALYTIRIGILSILFFIFTKTDLRKTNKVSIWQTFLIAIAVAIEYPAYYFAIQKLGVVETSLIMLLAPVLILFSSKLIFKEKLTIKKAVSSIVILICIATAIIIS